MSVSATAKNTGISVKKIMLVIDLIRGKPVDEALTALRFMSSPSAAEVAKAVKSASANAENAMVARRTDLRIVEIYVNEGPKLKRFRARARGRAAQINRRSSHITVVVEEDLQLGQ